MSDNLVQSVDQKICERWHFTISELSREFPPILCSVLYKIITVKHLFFIVTCHDSHNQILYQHHKITHQSAFIIMGTHYFIHEFVWDSTVSTPSGYGLNGRRDAVQIPVGTRFSPFHTGSGVHSASYTMGISGFFPRDKTAWAWNWPSPATSVEVKNTWIYTSTPHRSSWCCA
jgi:hypothetical protein